MQLSMQQHHHQLLHSPGLHTRSPRICGCVVPTTTTTPTSTSGASSTSWHSGVATSRASCIARAAGGGKPPRFTSAQDDPLQSLERPVPEAQRPVNELQGLKQAQLYSWAMLPLRDYVLRLVAIFVFFYAFVGGPISMETFDPLAQPVAWALSATVGSLVVVAAVVVRIFLGWSYVGNRLMSAAVEYEETGWYDGEVFVKPPEVLTRDRLLGMYEVKPVLSKLRGTLIGSGSILLVCAVALSGLISSITDEDGVYGRGAARGRITSDGVIFSKNVQSLSQLKDDDELAAEEAAAAGGIPGYCRDRLLRAQAGGQMCDKFHL